MVEDRKERRLRQEDDIKVLCVKVMIGSPRKKIKQMSVLSRTKRTKSDKNEHHFLFFLFTKSYITPGKIQRAKKQRNKEMC